MATTFSSILAGSFISASLAIVAPAYATDVSISGTIAGSSVTIGGSSDRFAGAIDSLIFRSVQYINSADHGREWQSASSFDNYGECYNPTEAGTRNDGSGSTSQSSLLSISNAGGTLTTKTNMAFWLAPGTNYGKPCGSTSATTAQNTTVLSGHLLTKTVKIGYAGFSNLIQYSTAWYLPESRSLASFEAGTGYMPTTFSVFLTYDPYQRVLQPVVGDSSTAPVPIIVATANGSSSMSAVSASTPIGFGQYYAYAKFSGAVSKWSCVYYTNSGVTSGSTYNFSCPTAIGTVDEVISTLNQYPSSSSTGLVPVLRFNKLGRHYFSTDFGTPAAAGYTFEGTGFRAYPSNTGGTYVPLYKCFNASTSDHFASISSSCEGTTVQGTYGYIASSGGSGLSPLYRFRRASDGDHLETLNYSEGAAGGYTLDGTLGYVPSF